MTTLDYSQLTSSVTRHDVAEFRRQSAGSISAATSAISVAVVVVLIVAAAIFFSTFLSVSSRFLSGGPSGFVIVVAMFVAAGLVIAVHLVGSYAKWARLLRLSRFAQANGLTLTSNGLVPSYAGAIFGIGSARRVPERLSRTSAPPIDVGNLTYTTGSGKNRKVHHWGYLAIKLGRTLPHMVLDAKANNFFGSNLPTKFSRSQVLQLEGDFHRYFTLYCPQEYEPDALYVFTPDLMARLIDEAVLFDVEIIDDWMFLYSARPLELTNAATIARIFRIVDTVGDKIVGGTKRYADDRVTESLAPQDGVFTPSARMAHNTVARQGRRLQRGIPVATLIIVVAIAGIWFFNILPMFANR